MATEQFVSGTGRYFQMQPELATSSSVFTLRQIPEAARIFDELPQAKVVEVAADISPMLLTYDTIEFQYKQFKWRLEKKAAQVMHLHFALKERAFIEEIHDKQEQVKEWLQNLGIGEHHAAVIQDDDEHDKDIYLIHHDESAKNRWIICREMSHLALFFQSFVLPWVGRIPYQIDPKLPCKDISVTA